MSEKELGVCVNDQAMIEVPAVHEDGSHGQELMYLDDLPGVVSVQQLSNAVQGMIAPVFEQFGQILERTNQAIERIAAANQMMNSRITELEKQVRLQKPVSRSQENYINEAIRKRARELLEAKGLAHDRRAMTKLGGMIRKAILARYGASGLRDYPAYDYETALEQAARWNDPLAVREIVKEARKRADRDDTGTVRGAAGTDSGADDPGAAKPVPD